MRERFFKTLAVVVLFVGVIFGNYFYIWRYHVVSLADRFSNAKRNIQELNEENDMYRKNIEPSLLHSAEDIKTARGLFFKPDPLLDFIYIVETLAKRNNLVHAIAAVPTADTTSSQISVTGSYQNIIRFLREIENDALLIRVQSVALQGSGKEMTANILIKLKSL
ncbi:MAG: hypothetical protein AAB482_03065 [Patescibacteria group bacterium]|mgnify:CR=1 FL=1